MADVELRSEEMGDGVKAPAPEQSKEPSASDEAPAPEPSDEHPGGRDPPTSGSDEEGQADVKPVPESKAAALRAITQAVEAARFPTIASDWEEVEMCCVAMNDHYVEHMKCPREMLMNRNNRVLDPTHYTSLPGKVRLGIRSAFAYGHNFSACFESVKTADRGQRFMKSVAIRTVALDRHRFIIGWQHTLGEKTYGRDTRWWQELEALVARAAAAEKLQARWFTPEDAAAWEGCEDGYFIQTETLCRKERLDEAVVRAVNSLPFPALACDPFLPECPVIALNAAARALTGWAEVGKGVAAADKRLLDGAKGAARGAYHINYGQYGEEESEHQERLSVRAACSNGRPCTARFRDMYGEPGEEAPCMWLQGATLAQGVNAGPLSGCDVWYLLGVLGEKAELEEWSSSAKLKEGMDALRSSLAKFIDPRHSPWLTTAVSEQEAGHPYGGDVKLLQMPLWHGAAQS